MVINVVNCFVMRFNDRLWLRLDLLWYLNRLWFLNNWCRGGFGRGLRCRLFSRLGSFSGLW